MKPSIGRIVHIVLQNTHYAAIITAVNDDKSVNLFVFPTANLFAVPASGERPFSHIQMQVAYSDEALEYSWHWPERVD